MKDTPNKIVYGINQDRHPSEQPQGTVRFVLNGVKGIDGNYHFEESTQDCLSLSSGYKVVGSIYLDDGYKVLFVTNNTTSKIILLSSDCISTELVSSDELTFSYLNKPITGEYRITKGCNRTIYWCDGENRNMYLDIDDLDNFKTDGEIDVNKMKFIPDIIIPKFDELEVNQTGGNLATGAYRFQIEYVDSNGNSFYRSPVSQPTIIFADSSFQSYQEINGNYNLTNFTADIGGQPNTTKSITLSISNLDTSFDFIKINVFRNITGLANTTDSHSIGVLIPITDESLTYIYTGYSPEQGDIIEDVNKLISLPINYSSSLVMEQVQDRLVQANMKQFSRDYSLYQQAVNDITAQWIVDRETPFDKTEDHNPKNPDSYQNGNTFIGDEIYAVGISFLYTDGTESPVFHKPGPEATLNDIELLTVGTDISIDEVKHLGLKTNDTVESYKVFNTANSSGKLGYYESATNYPLTTDCNGDYIYGDLAGTPIRHHRMPSRRKVPVQTTEGNSYIAIQHLGLEFDNIVYPESDIIGHRFHLAKHTDTNRTVLDTGLLTTSLDRQFTSLGETNTYTIGHTIEHPNYVYTDNKKFGFISPQVLLGKYLNATHLTINGNISRSSVYNEQETYDTAPGNSQFVIRTAGQEYINTSSAFALQTNMDVSKSVLTAPRSRTVGIADRTIRNESYSNYLMYLESSRFFIATPQQITYVTLKNNISPFNNLDSIVYYPITEFLTLSDSQQVFNGGGFIVEFEFMNMYNALRSFGHYAIQGDFLSTYTNKVWIETVYNYNLINNGLECNARYVQGTKFGDYLINKVATYNENDDDWNSRSTICKENYYYNIDFNEAYSLTPYKSIPSTYNYCNKCIDYNPTRIIFSPKSFQEELTDYYRVNLIDDYIDLPSNRGEITGLKYKNNKLYVHTTQTTFILQPNPQFVATDQNTAYLNTGDFLSVPPIELIQTDTGYGGMQNKLASTNSEFGYVWADTLKNKVYMLTDSIQEISRNGLFSYFKDNMRFSLDEFYKLKLSKSYPYKDHPYYVNGLGIIAVYDPYEERVIITKRDYLIKEELFEGVIDDASTVGTNIKELKLYLDKATGQFFTRIANNIKYINLNNALYFCNTGFTISYSLRDNQWSSWHSYIHDNLFFDNNYFYSVLDNVVYKHQYKNNYLNYANKNYEFILETVVNDYQTDNLSSVHYYADFIKDGEKVDSNYTNLLVYNSNQSTGKLNLINTNQITNPYGDLILDNINKSIVTTDGNSKITNLWDYSISNKIYSKDCRDLGIDFIDLVPINIDFDKSSYSLGELRDKFALVRLFYYPDDNEVSLTHIISNTQEINSIR